VDFQLGAAMRSAALLPMFLAATTLIGGRDASKRDQFRALMLWLAGCIRLFRWILFTAVMPHARQRPVLYLVSLDFFFQKENSYPTNKSSFKTSKTIWSAIFSLLPLFLFICRIRFILN
jgi:hypothetical protein